jgi:hypothetical protein
MELFCSVLFGFPGGVLSTFKKLDLGVLKVEAMKVMMEKDMIYFQVDQILIILIPIPSPIAIFQTQALIRLLWEHSPLDLQ